MIKIKSSGYWTPLRLQEESLKHPTRGEFQKYSASAYVIARRNGILDTICSHMTPSLTEAYTLEEIQLEANKHRRRKDFEIANPSMYVVAWRRKDFDQICAHMKPSLTEAYALEEIELGASQCTEYGEFKGKYPHLYGAASKRKILQYICRNMKHSKTTSKQENIIFDIVKSIYSDTKKLIDRKVKIEGKPHIKGFHVDIFVPQLNLGIEFDGTYWHSFESLKIRKPHWPDCDIVRYHQLKDEWFASKGINILHIKEEDWIKDKEICIRRCLNFLLKK